MNIYTDFFSKLDSRLRGNDKIVFSFFWRLSILFLPWQTRWFVNASLAGWPWEQGRVSVYVVWLLMLIAIVAGWKPLRLSRRMMGVTGGFFGISVLAVVLSHSWLQHAVPVAQWWVSVMMLSLFGLTLFRAQISRRDLARMVVISLIPVAVFGCWQFAAQHIDAMKWLGVAAQDPRNLGVSVIEVDDLRALRAYGSFPHPNIFGAWMMLGVLLAIQLAARAKRKIEAIGLAFASALFSVALLLSFARSAWLALMIGLVFIVVSLWRRAKTDVQIDRQFLGVALVCSMIALGVIGYAQRVFISSRVTMGSRLEVKSVSQRERSWKDGWDVFVRHPFGTGPNAELLDLRDLRAERDRVTYAFVEYKTLEPLEPPHNVPLLFLVDFGVLGVALCAYVVAFARVRLWRVLTRSAWIVFPCVVFAFVDHALFSTWAGMCLMLFFVVFCRLDEEDASWHSIRASR